VDDPAGGPRVTVALATRNRGASVLRTLASVLGNGLPATDVVVVDQSDDEATAIALAPYAEDRRVRYRRMDTVGLARAHNVAIADAAGELVAITDDDCEVAPDWLGALAGAFAVDERIGVVFGSVRAADHDQAAGFVPAYPLERPVLARRLRDKARVDGMGACMGVRRRVWEALGGFDERFGAGAPFRAANEGEFAIRALAAGWFVYETPALWVVHHGFRDAERGRTLIQAYAFGTGAMMATHLRGGTPHTRRLLVAMGWRWARGRLHGAVRLDGGRHRVLRLGAFARGFVAALGAR